MSVRIAVGVILVSLAAAAAQATTACDLAATPQYQESVSLVDSLRLDKAGQARVFASDGTEFTAGQALWMQARMRKVERLCASSAVQEQAEAARLLSEVTELLQSHRRSS